MDRRVTPPKRVTSPTWGPPPPCKQALKFRTRQQTTKPQTNYRCCLRFSFLTPYWLSPRNTVTFHKYFWCSWFCEFHSNTIVLLIVSTNSFFTQTRCFRQWHTFGFWKHVCWILTRLYHELISVRVMTSMTFSSSHHPAFSHRFVFGFFFSFSFREVLLRLWYKHGLSALRITWWTATVKAYLWTEKEVSKPVLQSQ